MIETEDLCKQYRMGAETIHALDQVSLSIAEGESVAVLGPSGSGKSTLLHLLGGLDTPTSGRIEIGGQDLTTLTKGELATYRNRKVGFVFQSFHLQGHLTAIENVALPLKIRGVRRSEREEIARKRLEEVGLADRVGHRPSELSGGQRQRVSVARALAGDPLFLLADEPTGNLDTKTGREIIDLFLRLNEEKNLTLVTVTHDPAVASRVGRKIELLDGRIVQPEENREAVHDKDAAS